MLSRACGVSILLAVLAVTGCARLGTQLERAPLPAGTPDLAAVLNDLAANDLAIKNFKASGTFTLESPDLSATKVFKNGTIAFRRPDALSVVGRNRLGIAAFQLTCVGSEFLIEFPASREEPYYKLEGENFEDVPFSVSPADIAREMFLPESWAELKAKNVRLTDYDAGRQTVTLEIGPKRAPARRVIVEGPAWHVVQSDRLEEGQVLATTTMGGYREVDGIRFPARIDARFPGQATRMTFELREIWPNTKLADALFDVKARAREAGVNPARKTKEKPNDHRRTKPR